MQASAATPLQSRDIRGLIFDYFTTESALQGRRVCRAWKTQITESDILWQRLEGFTFPEFLESRKLVLRVSQRNYTQHKFELGDNHHQYVCKINRFIISYRNDWVWSYDTETQAQTNSMLRVNNSTSPNYRKVEEQKLYRLPAHSYFTNTPQMTVIGETHVAFSENSNFSIWDLTTLSPVFSQCNLQDNERPLICDTDYGVAYITYFEEAQIWDWKTHTQVFNHQIESEIQTFFSQKNLLLIHGRDKHQKTVLTIFDITENVCRSKFDIDYAIFYQGARELNSFLLNMADNSVTIVNAVKGTAQLITTKGHARRLGSPVVFIDSSNSVQVWDCVKETFVDNIPKLPNIGTLVYCLRGLTKERQFLLWKNNKHYTLMDWNTIQQGFVWKPLEKISHTAEVKNFIIYKSLLFLCFKISNSKYEFYIFDARNTTLIWQETINSVPLHINGSIFINSDTNNFIEYRFTESKST